VLRRREAAVAGVYAAAPSPHVIVAQL